MAAKELKALVDLGTSLGYAGEYLKQWVNDERMRVDREKEKVEELKRQEEEKQRAFELEKVKIEEEAQKESERKRLEAEAERAKIEAEKEKESERMKLETEAQKESECMKFEAETKRAKIEAGKESERMKTEAEQRRQEFELRKLEMEQDLRLREVQVNVEQNGGSEGGVPRSNRGHSVAMKALKLPLFNDEKDDLDAYLIRLERACTAFEIRPEFWSTQLARLLQGRSLDVYQRLSAEEVDNYESLKTQLLKRFHLTEGGYRKKFKMSKLEVGESPEQFVERLNRYIVKWCEMAGYDNDYDGLKSLIIRDQFFITCDRQLQTFLKEKGKLSL